MGQLATKIKSIPLTRQQRMFLITLIIPLLVYAKQMGGFKFILKKLFRTMMKSKSLKNKVQEVVKKDSDDFLSGVTGGLLPPEQLSLPSNGLEQNDIFKMLEDRKQFDLDPQKGVSWAYVYDLNKEHTEFITKVHDMFIHTNMLNPLKFVSLRTMECEIIAMTASMFHGSPFECAGSVSSGGSESLALAILAYRNRAQSMGVQNPEIIICTTAHPAIHKACHYFQIKIIKVGYNPKTFQMSINETKKI